MQFVLPFAIIKNLSVNNSLSYAYRFVNNNFTSVVLFTILKLLFMILSLSLIILFTAVILVLIGTEPSQLEQAYSIQSIIMYVLILPGLAIVYSITKVYKAVYIKKQIK